MYIVPLTGINPMKDIASIDQAASTAQESGVEVPFADVFKEVLGTAVDATNTAAQDSVDAVLGDVDNLHTITINMEKATAAVELLSTVRNKALDAYNEVMRMSI